MLFSLFPLAQQQQQEQEQLMQLRVASWLKALQGVPEATTGLKGQSATFLLLTTVCVSVCLCVCTCLCVCMYAIIAFPIDLTHVRMLKLLLYAPIKPLPPSSFPRFSGIGASVVVGFSFYIISFRLISIFRQISHTHTQTSKIRTQSV